MTIFQPKKIKSNRRFQHIVEAVEGSILAGELRPGDQLPPELELKDAFGTGRGTVREALRVLEEKGLIIIKPGAAGGAFVKAADPAKLTEHLDLLVQAQSISPDHIKEFREAVEPVAAALAAARIGSTGDTATDADTGTANSGASRLGAAFDIARQGLENRDPKQFMAGDVAVHVAIAELTGNPLLTAVLRMVHEHVLGTSDDYALEGDNTLEDNLEDLRGLVEAVTGGHADDAGRRAMDHVRKFHGRMKATKGETA